VQRTLAILGSALFFVVVPCVLGLACHLFVVAYEEPTLERTFGAEYEAFRANVPRWIPRLAPWREE
jgi:protein-S-isoprenylcysteine O-methyltransferase Ste14